MAWRLTALSMIVITCTVVIFSSLIALRLNNGAVHQQKAVETFGRDRFSAQLRLKTQLVLSEFERMQDETNRHLTALSSRKDIADVVLSRNIVAIDMAMKVARENGPVDSLIALDLDLNAVGSHKPGLALLEVNTALKATQISDEVVQMVKEDFLADSSPRQVLTVVSPAFAEILGIESRQSGGLAIVSAKPLLDEFGDPVGVLIAYRMLNSTDPTISGIMDTKGHGIQILRGQELLFATGEFLSLDVQTSSAPLLEMNATRSGEHLFKCAEFQSRWRLCLFEPLTKMKELTGALSANIQKENRSLIIWISILGMISLAIAAVTAYLASSRVLAPLHFITDAVRSVARGNWLVHVAGQRRKDEVGEIARAVYVLKKSVKEREKLRTDAADIDQVRRMKVDLLEAANMVQSSVRKSLFGISDLTEKIEYDGKKLCSNTGLAEGENDEVRLTMSRALKIQRESAGTTEVQQHWEVEGAMDRLQETIGTLRKDSEVVLESATAIGEELYATNAAIREFLSVVEKCELAPSPTLPAVLEEA